MKISGRTKLYTVSGNFVSVSDIVALVKAQLGLS
jgi:hypothetical protein